MINYEEEVKKVYPDAVMQNIGYFDWHAKRLKGVNPKFIVTGYFVNIPTIWMPQAKYPEQAWKIAYEKLNQPNTMTPLQKSIAEIEAKIAVTENEAIKYKMGCQREFQMQSENILTGLRIALRSLTANLEYEREEIEKAYKADRYVSNDQADYYYTKTYDNGK